MRKNKKEHIQGGNYMAKPVLESKSLMLVPICNGDQVAAAILDYVYLYFQQPNPYELFFSEIQRKNEDVITDDFYRYIVREEHPPFNLDVEHYPNTWLSITLAELQAVIGRQFDWSDDLSAEDLLEGLKLLQNKGYMSIEDW